MTLRGQAGSCLDWDNIPNAMIPCPGCGKVGSLMAPRKFNMMFKTFVGASEDSSSVAYLRPETAQGIFTNYMNVLNTARVKVPFGIAQVGKAFRNEINPRNFTVPLPRVRADGDRGSSAIPTSR